MNPADVRAAPDETVVFDDRLPLRIAAASAPSTAPDHHRTLHLFVAMRTITAPIHKKVLLVRLTDDSDPYFLYTMEMGDEDFGSLKNDQSLLVDFADFASHVGTLASHALAESRNAAPRYLLQLSMVPTGSLAPSTLSFVETNTFKYLTHLALRLVAGSDAAVKHYLADCLRAARKQCTHLSADLNQSRQDLGSRVDSLERALADRTATLDRLHAEHSASIAELKMSHANEANEMRESMARERSMLQAQLDTERASIEARCASRCAVAEERANSLDARVNVLTRDNFSLETRLRECDTSLKRATEQNTSLETRAGELDARVLQLDALRLTLERDLGERNVRIAALEQEVKDKESSAARVQQLLDAAGESKDRGDHLVAGCQRELTRLETELSASQADVAKANTIIAKLQSQMLATRDKLKQRNVVTLQQEKLLNERIASIDSLKLKLDTALEEARLATAKATTLEARVEESRAVIKTNENVIAWLNKQLGGSTGALPVLSSLPLSKPSLSYQPQQHLSTAPRSLSSAVTASLATPHQPRSSPKSLSPESAYSTAASAASTDDIPMLYQRPSKSFVPTASTAHGPRQPLADRTLFNVQPPHPQQSK